VKEFIKKSFNLFGWQIIRFPNPDHIRRGKIIAHYNINKVLDVGANAGQYALKLREINYTGKIISFEPLTEVYNHLTKTTAKDTNWTALNYAIGDSDTLSTINVSGNLLSSSILNILPTHVEAAPESGYVDKQEIRVQKLDVIFKDFYEKGDRVMLKIDTQGYEKNVLDGAQESLKKISILQLEMSIVPLYENEMLYLDMLNYLNSIGFELLSLENGFSDETTGKLLQVDGIFVNRNNSGAANS
jgi:FkbM family methyltransferase